MTRKMKDSGVEFIGEIPEDWSTIKLKKILSKNDGGVWGKEPGNNNGTIVLRSTEQKSDGTLIIENPAKRSLTEKEIKQTLLKSGDILITKSSGSELHIGKASYINEHVESLQCCYSNFMQRLRIGKGYDKYYYYIINGEIIKKQFIYLSTTTTGLNNISADIINNVYVPLTSIEKQKAIADFLDKKTQEIDNIISKTKKAIEEYKKYKQSLITETVTKGLDENVEMKDSGIEWIGEIPEHWDVVKLKHVTSRIGDGLHGTPNYDEFGEYYFINGNNLRDINLKTDETTQKISEKEYRKYNHYLTKKSLLISLNGTIGNMSYYNGEQVMLGKSVGYMNLNEKVEINYVYQYLKSRYVKLFFDLSFAGTTINNLSLNTLRNTQIMMPPLKEQEQIASYLDKKTNKIDQIISTKEKLLREMEAYKKSLIYETVTGKREVE